MAVATETVPLQARVDALVADWGTLHVLGALVASVSTGRDESPLARELWIRLSAVERGVRDRIDPMPPVHSDEFREWCEERYNEVYGRDWSRP
jgi:hypothetical protein